MTTKAKYNWVTIKVEYFNSNYKEVKGFFEAKYSTYNGYIRSKTKGWTEDKQQWQQSIAKQALADLKTKRAEQLSNCLDKLLLEISRRMSNISLLQSMSSKDLRTFWEIIRCENGLPIRITHSQINDNTDLEEARKSLNDKLSALR